MPKPPRQMGLDLFPRTRKLDGVIATFIDKVDAMEVNTLLIFNCGKTPVDSCRGIMSKIFLDQPKRFRTFSEKRTIYVIRLPYGE